MKKKIFFIVLVMSMLAQSFTVYAAAKDKAVKKSDKVVKLEEIRCTDEYMEWDDLPELAGKEVKLEKEQERRAVRQNATTDISDIYEIISNPPYSSMSPDELNKELFWMGGTRDFSVYFTAEVDKLFIRTPNDKFVEIDTYFTNTGMSIEPKYFQYDYDGDGADEFMLSTVAIHGMSISMMNVESLFVIDTDKNGKWIANHLRYDDFMKYVGSSVSAVAEGDKYYFSIKDKKIDEPITFSNGVKYKKISYNIDSIISFLQSGKDMYICLSPMIVGMNTDKDLPWGEFPDYLICCKVNYSKDGKFTLGKINSSYSGSMYFEQMMDSVPDGTMYQYFEGPSVTKPVLMISKEQFLSFTYNTQPKDIEGYIIENGKLVSIGKLEANYSTYGFRQMNGYLYAADVGCFIKYAPDYSKKCWKVVEAAYKDGTYINASGKKSIDKKKYDELSALYYEASILYVHEKF